MVWIKFVICVAIIFIAGTRLSKYGDIIADKTGLGRVWVGTILLAAATSLPELVVGINSVTVIGKPDLTVGNLLGASLFNLVAIAYMDIMYRQGPLLYYVSPRIALSAVAGGLLIALVGASIFIAHNISPMGIANYIGIYSPILFILYLLIYQMLARYEKASQPQGADNSDMHSKHKEISSKKAYLFFALASLAIVGAGTWLSFLGDEISEITGLQASFIGTLFMAFTTSLPELVVSISALRLKALDMAVGNVVGSNLFNMGFILFIDDLFYTKGPLLSYVSQTHVFTALIALMMSCVVTIGLIFRPRFWPRSWVGFDGVALLILYIAAFYALYLLGSA
jgi:cation:H+ antiporter